MTKHTSLIDNYEQLNNECNLISNSELSLYIHWPFCLSKCPYCDFNSHVANSINHDRWLSCYLRELEYFASTLRNKSVKSIFFGGGTPSLMKPHIIAEIINKIASLATVHDHTEITLEANPTSFEIDKFRQFRLAGINRVSTGVQALNNDDLQKLGREHSVNQAIEAIQHAANIFPRSSFDLIYARTNQTLAQWQDELKMACSYAQGHISLYQLTIEKGTPFYKLFHDGKLSLPDNEISATMYEWTTEHLANLGYNRYEISNYAKPNDESIHNLTYWHYQSYLGIGPGAHSRLMLHNKVYSMMMSHAPNKWLQKVEDIGHGVQSFSMLNDNEAITEALMMGLRVSCGVKLQSLQRIADPNIIRKMLNYDMIKYYQDLRLLIVEEDSIRLTDKGLMLHNYIVPRIIND